MVGTIICDCEVGTIICDISMGGSSIWPGWARAHPQIFFFFKLLGEKYKK